MSFHKDRGILILCLRANYLICKHNLVAFDFDTFKSGWDEGLHGKYTVVTWNLGSISAYSA
jgi:hypothetical protein